MSSGTRGSSKNNWYRKSFIFQGKGSKAEFRRKERAYNNAGVTDGRLAFLTGGEATQISMEDLSEGDVVIATMGPTGSGKSTFIYTATGVDTGIGHSLESCTNEVKMVKFSFPEVSNCSLVFVDMPPFDDTRCSGSETLRIIQMWLQEASKKNIAISGLLYFHRISDNRMAGIPLKNLRIFDDLSKKYGFRNVVITTTMWDEVDEDLGAAREEELKSKYWEPILGHSMTRRFLHTRQSAFLVLEGFIDAANRDFSLLVQEELACMREHIGGESVGLDLSKRKATRISVEELSEGDVVIVVMGSAGSGKSTFIYTATGVDTGIGHSLESCTSEIKMVRFSPPEVINCSLVLVDMPSFDDERSSSADVQRMIRNWLQEAFKKNIAISGLLYFHRISDNHIVGNLLKHLLIFDRFTRDHGFQNVIITTTMWDEIEQQVGAAHEEELKSKYWKPILGHSTTRRFLNSRLSAFTVLEGFIDTTTRDFSPLIHGMREHSRYDTVGLVLLSKVESSVKEQDEVLKRLRIEMKTTMLLGGGMLESLLVEYRTIREELAVAVEEMRKVVDVPIGKRLSSLIG